MSSPIETLFAQAPGGLPWKMFSSVLKQTEGGGAEISSHRHRIPRNDRLIGVIGVTEM